MSPTPHPADAAAACLDSAAAPQRRSAAAPHRRIAALWEPPRKDPAHDPPQSAVHWE